MKLNKFLEAFKLPDKTAYIKQYTQPDKIIEGLELLKQFDFKDFEEKIFKNDVVSANDLVEKLKTYVITPADNKWSKAGRSYIAKTKKAESDPEKAKYAVDPKTMEAIENKCSKHGFVTYIRMVVSAENMDAAKSHLSNMVSAFTQFPLGRDWRRGDPRSGRSTGQGNCGRNPRQSPAAFLRVYR